MLEDVLKWIEKAGFEAKILLLLLCIKFRCFACPKLMDTKATNLTLFELMP